MFSSELIACVTLSIHEFGKTSVNIYISYYYLAGVKTFRVFVFRQKNTVHIVCQFARSLLQAVQTKSCIVTFLGMNLKSVHDNKSMFSSVLSRTSI